jgi:hypothetical protein
VAADTTVAETTVAAASTATPIHAALPESRRALIGVCSLLPRRSRQGISREGAEMRLSDN